MLGIEPDYSPGSNDVPPQWVHTVAPLHNVQGPTEPIRIADGLTLTFP